MSQREFLLQHISDVRKSIDGCRPSMHQYERLSDMELESIVKRLDKEVEAVIDAEEKEESKALESFKVEIQMIANEMYEGNVSTTLLDISKDYVYGLEDYLSNYEIGYRNIDLILRNIENGNYPFEGTK